MRELILTDFFLNASIINDKRNYEGRKNSYVLGKYCELTEVDKRVCAKHGHDIFHNLRSTLTINWRLKCLDITGVKLSAQVAHPKNSRIIKKPDNGASGHSRWRRGGRSTKIP